MIEWQQWAVNAAELVATVVIAAGLLQILFYIVQLMFAAVSLAQRPPVTSASLLWERFADRAPPMSVLAPAFNEEVTIVESVKSLLALQYPKFEIVVINDVTGKTFFNLLRMLTVEGAYADPLYGGNKNMEGWRMRKYPGNQMAYTDIMAKDEFVAMEPRSLHDHFGTH